MRGIFLLVWLLVSFPLIAAEPSRTIAILENERLLEAEPNIRLIQFFRSPVPEIRSRAVLAAARIGNKQVLPHLSALVTDKNVEVRKHLAFALGQIRAKEGLPLALTMLKDSDLEVRRLVIEAIGRIGGLEASQHLTPFLNDPQVPLREQAALAMALVKDVATVPALIEKASHDDPAQWSYVYALYRLADQRALPVLHQVLSKPSVSPSTAEPSSLLFSLKALWSMKQPLSAEEANQLLQHPDARVQQNALDVLSVSGNKDTCTSIEKHYPEMVALSKLKAIETMGALGCVESIEKRQMEENSNLRGVAMAALTKTKKEDSAAALRKPAKDSSWIVRWRIAQALSDVKEARDLLQELMADPDPSVKLAALESLTQFLPEIAPLYEPLLKSSDFAVRAIAADALGKTKNPKYLPLLIDSYENSTNAAEIEGRTANLDAIAEFNSSESLALYQKALLDPEYTVRRHAIDGIKKLVGSQFYANGKIEDPENFLYPNRKVSTATMQKYPAEFGGQMPELFAEMVLDKGTIVIRLLSNEAPVHVANFKKLAEKGFYDGLRIHRVVPNFVIQGGDPTGTGWGGAGEIVHDQMNLQVYRRGMVGMPLAGKDTGGSQFFITHSRQPHLDGNYTIFGEVISGMEVVDTTEVGDRIRKVSIRTSRP